MSLIAHSVVDTGVKSTQTGLDIGRRLLEGLGESPAAVVLHTTNNHDTSALLRAVGSAVGPDTLIVGCSAQGVMGRGFVKEGGYVAGAMAFGGTGLHATTARADNIKESPHPKGRAMGKKLRDDLSVEPKVAVIYYDPLCGADVGALVDGLREGVGCPVIGGGAGQDYGPMVATYQFFGGEVMQHGAVALAFGGDLSVSLGACHGTTPVGICMTVTRADGPCVLELDGRQASDVWVEMTGEADMKVEHAASMAIGLPGQVSTQGVCRVLAPFGVDHERRGIILQASVATGTEVMFHHRTEDSVRDGTRAMARQLLAQLDGRPARAVLGFECGARTAPFLGWEGTLQENVELQATLAPEAAWLGALVWGEIFPLQRGSAVFNFTYPILCLSE